MQKIDIILAIAEKAGLFGSVEFTTKGLAKELSVSQQSISNWLRRLEHNGLIIKEPSYSGTGISISAAGREWLISYKNRIDKLNLHLRQIKGIVFTGMNEGRFYIQQPGYKRQFFTLLGIEAFSGTLNLQVDAVQRQRFLQDRKAVIVSGFASRKRTFGSIRCYPVHINGIKAAVVVPERTHYKDDTIEIISGKYLRETLMLKDGDEVIIE